MYNKDGSYQWLLVGHDVSKFSGLHSTTTVTVSIPAQMFISLLIERGQLAATMITHHWSHASYAAASRRWSTIRYNPTTVSCPMGFYGIMPTLTSHRILLCLPGIKHTLFSSDIGQAMKSRIMWCVWILSQNGRFVCARTVKLHHAQSGLWNISQSACLNVKYNAMFVK